MSTDSLANLRRIFEAVVEVEAAERAAVLARACGDDDALKQRILAMVAAHEEDERFLSEATIDAAAAAQNALHAEPHDAAHATILSGQSAGQVVDRYKLLQPIGEGGFGTVWMAEQREPVKRRVALKIIKLGMDTKQVIARFEAERQALAMMDHPNIAKVFDAGSTDQGRPYFVMEYIKGIPIVEYCDTNELNTAARLGLFTKVCHAIQHAHQKGIIHRDIKPNNVLVTMHDGVPVPKVIDFGIAKATSAELTSKTLFTEHRQLIGTPAYMSPEQAEMSGLDIDTRADIYSLGVLLYELLTGTTPFDTKSLMEAGFVEMMRVIREHQPPKPSTRLSELGETARHTAAQRRSDLKNLGLILRGDLDWVVMKCLEKDRTRRYETANSLATDVQRHLDDEPVQAGPPSASYRLRKFIRRHRVAVIVAGCMAAILTLGAVGTTAGMLWAINEKDRADQAAKAEKTAKEEALTNAQRAIDEAERAEAAEAEAKARAKDLQLVADFQAEQLASIDARQMGVRLRESVLDAVTSGQREQLESLLASINFTNIGLMSMQENVFEPALAAIESQFEDQPLVRAQLLQTLASTLRELGLSETATKPQELALEIRREQLGDDHLDVYSSCNEMGTLLWRQGEFDEAEPFCRTAFEGFQRELGDDHHRTLHALNGLATVLTDQGRLAEAKEYLRDGLDRFPRALGDDHETTLLATNNLGYVLLTLGRLAEAEPYILESLKGLRRVFGDDHPATLAASGSMGLLYQSQGKLAEAEPHYLAALEGCRRQLGNEHPRTLTLMNNLGALLRDQGKLAEAEPYYFEALTTRRRLLGEDHLSTLNSMSNTATLLKDLGRESEAESLYREALAGARRTLSDDHPSTLVYLNNLGQFLRSEDRLAEATPYLRESLDGLRRALGNDHPNTIISTYNLGCLLRDQGDLEQSVPLLLESVNGARANFPETHPFTQAAVEALADLYSQLERFDEAEPLLTVLQAKLDSSLGPQHPRTRTTMEALAQLYENWHNAQPGTGYDATANAWRDRLDTSNRDKNGRP